LRILLFIAFFTFFSASAQQDTTIYSTVDKEAEFPGGPAAMMTWIQNNLVYPNEITGGEIINRIYVTFIIEVDGRISQPTVVSKCENCSKILDNLILSSPLWTPAQLNGRNVRSKYVLPMHIDFD
jgi:protein TonB